MAAFLDNLKNGAKAFVKEFGYEIEVRKVEKEVAEEPVTPAPPVAPVNSNIEDLGEKA